MGCSVSDHGLEYVMYAPASDDEIESIFAKRLSGEVVSHKEELKFKTAFMLFAGVEYTRRNWIMHSYNCINNYAPSTEMADFLDALNKNGNLPKTIIYSLTPNDTQTIDTILGCFQDSTAIAKIQQGSAWWFNDHKTGIQDQMISLANWRIIRQNMLYQRLFNSHHNRTNNNLQAYIKS